jgi:hypothetical protein
MTRRPKLPLDYLCTSFAVDKVTNICLYSCSQPSVSRRVVSECISRESGFANCYVCTSQMLQIHNGMPPTMELLAYYLGMLGVEL